MARVYALLLPVLVALRISSVQAEAWTWPDDTVTWTLSKESNVYGSDYQSATVSFAGTMDSEQDCRDVCVSNTTCQSYTWTPGANPGKKNCKYVHQCWLRNDTVWHPKVTSRCAGASGYKGDAPTPPGPAPSPPSPSPHPPTPAPKGALNVLFVIFDDLRPNSAAYGLEQPSMPNVDALAKRSVTFTRAYCNQAVCGPSRASLLSGRRPDSTQMWNFIGGFRETPGADAWRTWPEYFRSKGWTAYGCGKLYHPGNPANFDQGRSWDTWGGYNGQGHCPKTPTWAAPNQRHGCAIASGTGLSNLPDEKTLSTAKNFLQLAKRSWSQDGVPFWLGVGFVRPHMPQAFPEEFLKHVPALEDIDVAKNQSSPVDTSPIEWGSGAEESGWQAPFPLSTQRAYRRGYYAAAAYSDSLMGKLLQELEAQGLQNDTIVIMTSDHGWGLGEHNHWIKYTNFESDTRVPLVIHHPKKPATWGTQSSTLVEHVDLYPTIAELAGSPVNMSQESIEGSSYAFAFDNAKAIPGRDEGDAFDAAYSQYPRCCQGKPPYDFTKDVRCANVAKQDFTYMGYTVRTAAWRYTEYALWDGKALRPIWNTSVPSFGSELYDHAADTGMGTSYLDEFENENLAFRAEHKATVQQLSQQLRKKFSHGEKQWIV